MTATADALLRAVLEKPHDDAPRLVYADWLEENARPCAYCDGGWRTRPGCQPGRLSESRCERCSGTGEDGRQERADFIETQIALARDGFWPCGKPRNNDRAGRARERELAWGNCGNLREWSGLRQPWSVGLAPDDAITPPTALFRRGFVESVACTTADFLAHAAMIFSAHPLTAVRLVGREPELPPECGYLWHRQGGPPETVLPAEIIQAGRTAGVDLLESFGSHADAHAALSLAAVAYGRTLAGLGPLNKSGPPRR